MSERRRDPVLALGGLVLLLLAAGLPTAAVTAERLPACLAAFPLLAQGGDGLGGADCTELPVGFTGTGWSFVAVALLTAAAGLAVLVPALRRRER